MNFIICLNALTSIIMKTFNTLFLLSCTEQSQVRAVNACTKQSRIKVYICEYCEMYNEKFYNVIII